MIKRLRLDRGSHATDSSRKSSSSLRTFKVSHGRIATDAGRQGLQKRFAQEGWELWNEAWLRDKLRNMADGGCENQVSAVVAKLLLRGTEGYG